ncbi:hypothetical protein L7F22_049868 [Adiantum nelumboides]|nr:hypothetical protein [Adiantum nelumboides]
MTLLCSRSSNRSHVFVPSPQGDASCDVQHLGGHSNRAFYITFSFLSFRTTQEAEGQHHARGERAARALSLAVVDVDSFFGCCKRLLVVQKLQQGGGRAEGRRQRGATWKRCAEGRRQGSAAGKRQGGLPAEERCSKEVAVGSSSKEQQDAR